MTWSCFYIFSSLSADQNRTTVSQQDHDAHSSPPPPLSDWGDMFVCRPWLNSSLKSCVLTILKTDISDQMDQRSTRKWKWSNDTVRRIFSRAFNVDCDGSAPCFLSFYTQQIELLVFANHLKSLFTKLEILDGWSEANQATHSIDQVIHHREKYQVVFSKRLPDCQIVFWQSLNCLLRWTPPVWHVGSPKNKLKHICR